MSAWEFLIELHKLCSFTSREKSPARASNSELKRWLQNKAVVINQTNPNWDVKIEFPVTSMILFPKSDKKVTLQ